MSVENTMLLSSMNSFNRYVEFLKALQIKDEVEARRYDTTDIYHTYSLYRYAIEQNDTFHDYQYHPQQLYPYGFTPDEALRFTAVKDEFYRIAQIDARAASFLADLRKTRIEQYNELNPYYRTFNGIPSQDSEWLYVKDYDNSTEDFEATIPIHRVKLHSHPKTYSKLYIERKINEYIDTYPELDYLKFLEKPLTSYTARERPQFAIMYYKEGLLSDTELEYFFECYNKARHKILTVDYIEGYERFTSYAPLMTMMLLYATTLSYFNKNLERFSLRNYSDEEIFDILDSNNLKELKRIDLATLRKVIEKLPDLEKNRGSDKVFDLILDIIGDSSIVIKRYYLAKRYKVDETNHLEIDVSKPYNESVDVNFIETTFKAKKLVKDIERMKIAYHDFVADDDYWGGVADVKDSDMKYRIKEQMRKELLSMNFSHIATKYINISKTVELYEKVAKIHDLMGIMFQLNYERGNYFATDLIVHSDEITATPIAFYAAWCYAHAAYMGLQNPDNIVSSVSTISDVMLLRHDTSLLETIASCENHELVLGSGVKIRLKEAIPTVDLKEFLVSFSFDETTNIDTVVKQYGDNFAIMKALRRKMATSSSLTHYKAFEYLYKQNLSAKNISYMFLGQNTYSGFLALTSTPLLDYITPIIANREENPELLRALVLELSEAFREYLLTKSFNSVDIPSDREIGTDDDSLNDLRILLNEYMSIYTQVYKVEFYQSFNDDPYNTLTMLFDQAKNDLIDTEVNILTEKESVQTTEYRDTKESISTLENVETSDILSYVNGVSTKYTKHYDDIYASSEEQTGVQDTLGVVTLEQTDSFGLTFFDSIREITE